MPEEVDVSNMTPEQIAEMQKQQCIFCHIASGKVPSKKIYEDDKCIAILDINPAARGHVLLFPKEHYPVMALAPDEIVGHIFAIAKGISNVMLKAFKNEGVQGTTIFLGNGVSAGQKAPHTIVHIIPRKEGDNLDLAVPENKTNKESLLDIRKKIIQSIKNTLGSCYELEEEPKITEKSNADNNIDITKVKDMLVQKDKEGQDADKAKDTGKNKEDLKQDKESISLDDIKDLFNKGCKDGRM